MKLQLLVLLILICNFQLSAQIINTYAGNGTYGNSGNGGPATSAQLGEPLGIVSDNAGNLYICDMDNNVIRKVSPSGIITVFAGTGALGYSGDGGPAIAAKLYHPTYINIDHAGNLYFTDQNADVIRRISNTGIISSITGNLGYGYTGDGGPVGNAKFGSISGIGFDVSNNMYISDYSFGVIRKVNSAGIISTVAGTGVLGYSGDGGPATAALLNAPYGVIFDASGAMLIPDARNRVVRKVNPAGIISTFAGNGTAGYTGDGGNASVASMNWPWFIVLDASENLYISDGLNDVIRKVDNGNIITTFAGNGVHGYAGDGGLATAAEMRDVCGIACDNTNNIYIVNRDWPNVIRKISNCLTAIVSQQPGNVGLCNVGNAVFSVTETGATNLRWQLNTGSGWTDLVDNTVYSGSSTSTLSITGATFSMSGYLYRCQLTNTCASIFSQAATLTVSAPSIPAITISSSNVTACSGYPITFTAIPSNGGTTPFFQWKKNGLITGTNSSSYTDNSLLNGDIINCIMTSSNTCVTTATANSNMLSIPILPLLPATITISSSLNNICSGTPVTFTALVGNAGSTPFYQWTKNGINTGTNNIAYTDITLVNGDIIDCRLTSSYACPANPIVQSNVLAMNVLPRLTPQVTISSTASSFCADKPATFSSSAGNGGTSPIYQWTKNGLNIGTNSPVLTYSPVFAGDMIACQLTSNASCLTAPSASSNIVIASLFPTPTVKLDHTDFLCQDDIRTLDAGSFSSYLWNDGSRTRRLPVSNTGKYYVSITDANGCNASDTTVISKLLPKPYGFIPKDGNICSYGELVITAKPGYSKYLWDDNSTTAERTLKKPGSYSLQVIDAKGCSNTEVITVSLKQCLKGFYIPNSFTPNNDGINDGFRPLLFGNILSYNFTIFNRYGQIVFQSTDPSKFWNGSFLGSQQNRSVFIWTCGYQLEGEAAEQRKGNVLLLR
ncbi:NHL domain-containing protein [Ferruginibacter profundus]